MTRQPVLWLSTLLGAALVCAACAEAALERLGLADIQPLSVAFVVHGQDDDPFWQEVRAGAEDAAQAFDASLSWQSSAQTEERVRMVDTALAQGFDVVVVTLSDPPGMERIVREAVVRGALVYVINEGVQYATGFGADAFFGMVETVAGLAAGERLAEAGATKFLCVLHEAGNRGLVERCEQAEFRIGEMIRLLVDPRRGSSVEARVAESLTKDPEINAVLTSDGSRIAGPATAAIDRFRAEGRVILHAAFGVDELVLRGIEDDSILFAVDEQPWLQGYLPVAYAQLKRYSARTRGDELASVMLQWAEAGGVLLGPGFVDRRNVEQVRSSGAVAVGAWWLDQS